MFWDLDTVLKEEEAAIAQEEDHSQAPSWICDEHNRK